MINDVFCYLVQCSYRDPKTGLPYATKEAFKTIRERYKFLFSTMNLFAIRSMKRSLFFFFSHQIANIELSCSVHGELLCYQHQMMMLQCLLAMCTAAHVLLCNCVALVGLLKRPPAIRRIALQSSCLIRITRPDSLTRERDQQFQMTAKHPTIVTLLVSAEFQHWKCKIQIRSFAPIL